MADEKDQIVELEPLETRPASLLDSFSPDRVEKFIIGEATLGQLYGITKQEAYSVAELAYTMMEQGRLKDAQIVFEGLTASNPYDAYFHLILGSIYQKQGAVEGAIEEYSIAIGLDAKSIEAYVNRGELLIQTGNFDQAAKDFKSAIDLDPNGKNKAVNRARALASVTATALQKALNQKN
jgi:tetratricopeptide (TPR) repeat protein